MRAEHWYDSGSQAGDHNLFLQAVASFCSSSSPRLSLAKPSCWSGHATCQAYQRTLATPHDVVSLSTCSQIIIAAKKQPILASTRPLEHGVVRPDDAHWMIKSPQHHAEAHPSLILAALNLRAAFQNIYRRAILHDLEQHGHDHAAVITKWCTGSTTHRMHFHGSYSKIHGWNCSSAPNLQ